MINQLLSTGFNTLDNSGHKTPTQSKRKRTGKKNIKGSIHSFTFIYIYVQYSTDNHYVTESSFPLPLYRQSLHGRNFPLFVTVLTIIIWQGVRFHYHCADNHYMAGTFFLFITVLKSLYSREFVSITAVPTIIPWRNFVLFITAPTISRELVSVNTVPTFHYMAGNLHPLKLYWHSTIWQEIYTR